MATDLRNRMEDYRPPAWPEDFGERLEGLKRQRSLRGDGRALGHGLKWRRGGRPSADLWIMELAHPGGYLTYEDAGAAA